ncbi:hypothetical protein RhiJN_08752 [Ceratobasidium sp. AG-Ba]|nr:hypothetical protein RhiJN_08752 [Ceratobasidium sp. AG-Ba]QRW09538.1 hypothetical protein RhiLY_08537 [Ceratobasidium sp. AG-Ba]
MARLKQAQRQSTGGKAPRRNLFVEPRSDEENAERAPQAGASVTTPAAEDQGSGATVEMSSDCSSSVTKEQSKPLKRY